MNYVIAIVFFIALTESHLNSSIEDSEIQINNFYVTRCDGKARKGFALVVWCYIMSNHPSPLEL